MARQFPPCQCEADAPCYFYGQLEHGRCKPMGRHIQLFMPRGGEACVIIATDEHGRRVEFRGRPYSAWDMGEDTEMYKLHSVLERINISELHNGAVETVTPWHVEWGSVSAMFDAALNG